MSETRHTPGDWTADYALADDSRGRQQWAIYADDSGVNGCLADLTCADGYRDPAEVAANAHLIAGAPGLLAACERALEALAVASAFGCSNDPKTLAVVIAPLRAAIARARGE
jgi:hypothetical protein